MSGELEAKRERLYARLRKLGRVLVAYSGGVDSAYLAWAAHEVLGKSGMGQQTALRSQTPGESGTGQQTALRSQTPGKSGTGQQTALRSQTPGKSGTGQQTALRSQTPGGQMLAVMADSPSLARAQMRDAVSFAEECGIPLEIVRTDELENADYQRNDAMRCFHCKDELFGVMEKFATANGWEAVAYGVNVDDQGDWRPGQKAARQHGVAAPLLEAGLTKADIRTLAAEAGLRVWDKPASACLSSRIEYGREVTREALEQVERGEDALRAMGFRQFRLRHHGDVARIEIAREEMERALTLEMFARMSAEIKACGFKYVALDVEGFRSGSMNAMLKVESLR